MNTTVASTGTSISIARSSPSYQAFRILHAGFIAAPILAGFDKFLHLMTNWEQYVAPWIANAAPGGAHGLMLIAGVVEIVAGLLVAAKPKIAAPIVAAWLGLIIVNLLSMGAFLDVALRDLGLALGALALWRLSVEFDS